jgi:hypothetical protein
MCLEHMTDITANNTHKFDDIADTCYDAVNAVFIDKIIINQLAEKVDYSDMARTMTSHQNTVDSLRKRSHESSRVAW